MSPISIAAFTTIFYALVFPIFSASAASNCSVSLPPFNDSKPSVAPGYKVALIANGLIKPRSIHFDTVGNLLVVQQGVGIVNLVFQDDGGLCLRVKSKREVIKNDEVGIILAVTRSIILTLVSAQSRHSLIARWKDSLCLFLRRSFFLVL